MNQVYRESEERKPARTKKSTSLSLSKERSFQSIINNQF